MNAPTPLDAAASAGWLLARENYEGRHQLALYCCQCQKQGRPLVIVTPSRHGWQPWTKPAARSHCPPCKLFPNPNTPDRAKEADRMDPQTDTPPASLAAAIATGWIDMAAAGLSDVINYSEWAEVHARPFVMVQPLKDRAELYITLDGRKRTPIFDATLEAVCAELLGDAPRWEEAEALIFDHPTLTAEKAAQQAAALGRAILEGAENHV